MSSDEMKVAIKAVKAAGKLLMKNFGKNNQPILKNRGTSITLDMDKRTEKLIYDIIRKEFPKHNFLSEEMERVDNKSDYEWVVDPIDGTTNYWRKGPTFAVSIALAFKNKPVMGVVYLPYYDDVFTAEKGKGAYLNGKKLKIMPARMKPELIFSVGKISVGKAVKIGQSVCKKMKKIFTLRILGSWTTELAVLATNKSDVMLVFGGKPWDFAAAVVIAREAGAKVTDFKGKDWTINSKNLLAAEPSLHKAVLNESK